MNLTTPASLLSVVIMIVVNHKRTSHNSCLPRRRRGIRLPAKTAEKMKKHIILERPATLTAFLGKFSEYMHVIA